MVTSFYLGVETVFFVCFSTRIMTTLLKGSGIEILNEKINLSHFAKEEWQFDPH